MLATNSIEISLYLKNWWSNRWSFVKNWKWSKSKKGQFPTYSFTIYYFRPPRQQMFTIDQCPKTSTFDIYVHDYSYYKFLSESPPPPLFNQNFLLRFYFPYFRIFLTKSSELAFYESFKTCRKSSDKLKYYLFPYLRH